MTGSPFYHFQSVTMTPCNMLDEQYMEALRTWLCPGCLTPKESCRSIDVYLQERVPKDPPLNGINGCFLGLAKKSFLEGLGPQVLFRDLFLGKVFGPTGRLLEDWVTFRGRYRLIIRGSREVSHRCCEACGRILYFAMGKRYLFPQPPEDADAFESDLCGLIIRSDLLSSLNIAKWPNVGIDELSIPSEPKDLLGPLR